MLRIKLDLNDEEEEGRQNSKLKSMLMYVCKNCNIYFPIRRMLELHDCKLKLNDSMKTIKTEADDDDGAAAAANEDENSWEVETLDENLPILAKAKQQQCKEKKDSMMRKCPFCPFGCDNSSTFRSHVKRKHYEGWLKLKHGKNATANQSRRRPPEKPCQVKLSASAGTLRSCPYCSFATLKKSTLYSHISRSHKGKGTMDASGARISAFACTGYACSYCTFAAATMASLKYHSAREHAEEAAAAAAEDSGDTGGQRRQPVVEFPVQEFDCEQCDYKANSRMAMQHHLKATHQLKPNDEDMFTCHLCSYETLSKMGLQRHISIKHDKPRRRESSKSAKVFSCALCAFQTLNGKLADWHAKRHDEKQLAGKDGLYYCNDCDLATWTKVLLIRHIRRNHRVGGKTAADYVGGSSAPLCCDRCDYTTKNKHVMKVHVIRKHTEGFNHACELCGKKYKVKADLTNHMRFQHREQPIICDVCGKQCRNSNLLYLHQKFAHYKPEFECKICKRRMVSQANLDEHVLKQHEQRQDVACEECGKSFSRQSRLKIHMRTHLGLRPYACKICGKSFARRNGLRQHLLIHSGQRPYVCDICGKDFTQKTGLISHRKSHPGTHPPLPRITIEHVLSGLLIN